MWSMKSLHQDWHLLWRSTLFVPFLHLLVVLKITLLTVLGCVGLFLALFFNIPDGFFEVFIVSDWFHKVAYHVKNPEHQTFLPLPGRNCVKTSAVSFKNYILCALFAIVSYFFKSPFWQFGQVLADFGAFWHNWYLLWSPHCLWLVW